MVIEYSHRQHSITMESRYPKNWTELSIQTRENANWKCEKCGAKHENVKGKRIQTHHQNYDPSDSTTKNLIALCPPCHLSQHKRRQGSVSPGQLTMLELLGIKKI
jgi:predicted HNH restriction endonuclease